MEWVGDILLKIIGAILIPVITTYIIKWINKLFFNRFFYSIEDVNEKVKKHESSNLETSKYLKHTVLGDYYPESFTTVTLKDAQNNKKTLRLPYEELIDFIQSPQTKITISNPTDIEKFHLREDIQEATDGIEKAFIKEGRAKDDDPHPRIASLTKTEKDDEYTCTIEKAYYFQQVRTNLSLDFPIRIKGIVGQTNTRKIDHDNSSNPKGLTDFSESCLCNAIGVSAIWMMGEPGEEKVFLLPRKKSVGVFEAKLGMPSGNVEMPKDDRFSTDSLVEFLTLDIAREFVEETGLCGENIDMGQFSQDVELKRTLVDYLKIPWGKPKPTMIENMEIIPLAFVRELLRGGKPQMFFLIRTPKVSTWTIRRSFRKSPGTKEFDAKLLTSATLSTETMCNYLYAQKWCQKNRGLDYIEI